MDEDQQTEPESPMNESRLPISILCPTATESLRKEILGPFGIASHLIRWEQLRSGQRTTKSTDRVKTPTIPIVMQPLGIQGKSPTNIMRAMHTNPAERMNGARTTVSLASNDVQVMELGYSRNQESMREVVRRWGDIWPRV